MSAASEVRARSSHIPYLLRWSDAAGQITVEFLTEVLMESMQSGAGTVLLQGVYMDGDIRTWMVLLSQPFVRGAARAAAQDDAAKGAADSGLIGLVFRDNQRETVLAELAAMKVSIPEALLLVSVRADVASVSLFEPLTEKVVRLFDFPADTGKLVDSHFSPFDSVQLGGKRAAVAAEPAIESPVAVPSETPAPSFGYPPDADPASGTHRRTVHLSWIWTTVGLVVIVAGFAFWQFAPSILNTAPKTGLNGNRALNTPLGLQVSRQEGNLQISWNRNLAEIQSADSGVLKITDSDQRFAIPLSRVDLANGSILYPSQSKSVRLELTITTPAGPETETIQLIVAESDTAGLPGRTGTQPAPPKPTTRPAAGPVRKTFTPPAPSTTDSEPSQAPAVDIPAAPQIAPSTTATQTPMAALPSALIPQQPISMGLRGLAAGSRPPPPAPAAALFEAAVPVKQSQPHVPAMLRQAMLRSVSIELTVAIDEKGTVTSARTRSYGGVAGHLAQLATESARTWKFRPARRNGQPISSELLVRFNFDK